MKWRPAILCCLAVFLPAARGVAQGDPPSRPNILWITCEDISPDLRCFGVPHAVTPTLDALAEQGVRYTAAFAPIGVCAPARSCLITGMYPPSLGSQHMRCNATLPETVRCFPELLREAGYYCTNNSKRDYNFTAPTAAWDVSSSKAHWRERRPGQPFFAVFNLNVTHESRIRSPDAQFARDTRRVAAEHRHDPAQTPIPPYHPDTPEVRRDWARYHDLITAMDLQVADRLAELEQAGLAENTIVFFFSDHGAGMPRSKRWLYDSSLRVPLIVRFPARYAKHAPAAPGRTTARLVSFVDFAPTVLSLAGVPVPAVMQGMAFLGDAAAGSRRYVHGFRDRMDERYDMLRCVRDSRYKYIRNFLPHRPYAQWIDYMFQMPTMRRWHQLAAAGDLRGPARLFWAPRKPREELYDTWSDPHEVHNLAGDADHADVLARLRGELAAWMTAIVDLGFLPESDLRTRFGEQAPYAAVRERPSRYPLQELAAAADVVGTGEVSELVALLGASDGAARWWGAVGLVARGELDGEAVAALTRVLDDTSPAVRVAAAEALARAGHQDPALAVLAAGLAHGDEWVRLAAANALDGLDERARPALEALRGVREDSSQYVQRVVQVALRVFE